MGCQILVNLKAYNFTANYKTKLSRRQENTQRSKNFKKESVARTLTPPWVCQYLYQSERRGRALMSGGLSANPIHLLFVGKSLNISKPQFPVWEMGVMIVSTSFAEYED